ncbi:MAG: BREX-3 system P-loop-containing protein BrxF [Verrucomicrobia bacterium]|nr:MAG: BREX-3 system P-loop-containing protein BrxF [Verrucomicrobiota bacterium]
MQEANVEEVLDWATNAAELYTRLVLVVGPPASGKTALLQAISRRTGSPLININLEMSSRMLELTRRQRALQAPRILSQIVREVGSPPAPNGPPLSSSLVLLDNIEILFDPHLKLNPLRLLQNLSRTTTVVAAWGGVVVNNHLTYAEPDHPEYKRYDAKDLIIVSMRCSDQHSSGSELGRG